MATLRARKESAAWPEYKMLYWEDFDFSLLKHIIVKSRSNKSQTTYNNVIIMADTETSKKEGLAKKDIETKEMFFVETYEYSVECEECGYAVFTRELDDAVYAWNEGVGE